ncbi:ABC transporter ATP-binding protein [bacterium]|nr:ABC transporter ATP-binding protein [bacterium]
MLKLEGIDVYYDSIQALRNLSLEVREGEIYALLGANGAGKTTTLKAISGLLIPRKGRIYFQNEDITFLPIEERVKRGISQVPEGRRVFGKLTVEENLLLGGWTKEREIKKNLEIIFSLFPVLKQRLRQLAGTLSGGEQQMLSIARALMSEPRLLLLDEPSLGLAPLLVRDIFHYIREINEERGVTILVVEQNAHMALQIAHRGGLLQQGELILEGSADELKNMELVKSAYLGG